MPRDNEKEKEKDKGDFTVRLISRISRSLSNEWVVPSEHYGSRGLAWTRRRSKNKRDSTAAHGDEAGDDEDEGESSKRAEEEGKEEAKGEDETKEDEVKEGKDTVPGGGDGEKKDDETEKGESSSKKDKENEKTETDPKPEKEAKSPRRGRRDSFVMKLTDDQKRKLKFSKF